MARMTSIIGNMAERENTVEGKEQINSLHFQMLQIITRISEMQTTLENPESKASAAATNRMQLNDKGEVEIMRADVETLTADIKVRQGDPTTKQYKVIVIDNNDEFLRFIMAHLRNVYDMHAYNDVGKALEDLEVLKASIIVCKQDMPGMNGSELCNRIKMNPRTENIKFVLMTDGVLTSADMHDMNITLSADDYLAKPFNIQEATLRFNRLLGLAPEDMPDGLIEGKETRRLETINASMTTATINYDNIQDSIAGTGGKTADDSDATAENYAECQETDTPAGLDSPESTRESCGSFIEDIVENTAQSEYDLYYAGDVTMGDYTMNGIMDRKLMQNVEQYVLQNMSHGHISLEEMASAMGMGRVPFFRKIRSITSKTPAELVRELRLKHACTLLARTDINMSELAINLGFMTAENFAAIFKDKHGMSPLEYRLKHRKKQG
ncbi:MAG: response regulator transcription factor [Prevotella sp.]|nr:response regulator transcription factor [Prevotella sp.]